MTPLSFCLRGSFLSVLRARPCFCPGYGGVLAPWTGWSGSTWLLRSTAALWFDIGESSSSSFFVTLLCPETAKLEILSPSAALPRPRPRKDGDHLPTPNQYLPLCPGLPPSDLHLGYVLAGLGSLPVHSPAGTPSLPHSMEIFTATGSRGWQWQGPNRLPGCHQERMDSLGVGQLILEQVVGGNFVTLGLLVLLDHRCHHIRKLWRLWPD